MEFPTPFNDPTWWSQRTSTDIDAVRAGVKARVRRLRLLHWLLCLASGTVVSTVTFSGLHLSAFDASTVPGGYLSFAAVGLVIFVLMCVVLYRRGVQDNRLELLKPLEGKAACEQVIGLLQQPQVLEYRDQVVRQRRELLGIDRSCMHELTCRLAAEADAARLEQLRQKVHTFVPSAANAAGAPA